MAFEPSFGQLDVAASVEVPTAEAAFRIAVLGDFSGGTGPASWKPLKVQRETLDEVLAKLKVKLQLADVAGEPMEVVLGALDDFHPDQLHEKIDRFAFVSNEDDKSALMAALLHHPQFQAVEAAWRGLDWFLRRAQKGDANVEVVLYDVSAANFKAAINSADDLTGTSVHQALIEQAMQGQKGQPWALLVGVYTFDVTGPDAQVLGRMAKIASQAASPFLTAMNARTLAPTFAPDAESAPAWAALRALPEAALLGLASPRFLLRLPYGENTQSLERFSFEEFQLFKDQSNYLWGNPALTCAALVAQGFAKEGWAFKPGPVLQLDAMPMHAYTKDDEEEVTLAETWLLRPAAEKISKIGIMPLLCVKGRNALQLYRFLSLAQPPKDQPLVELFGRWGQKGLVALPRSTSKPPMTVSAQFGPTPTSTAPKASASAPVAPSRSSAPTPAPELADPMELIEEPADLAAAPDPAAEPAVDPELAALMAQLEGTPDEPAPEALAAEEPALDSELDALMKQLEGPPDESALAAPAAEEPALDPELDALMKELEGTPDEPAPAASAAEEPALDPELDALMKQLEG